MNITSSIHKVLKVTEIELTYLKTFPPARLQVTVFGTVPSPGWTRPRLVPYTYVQAPPDGIYDFDFVATPPADIVAKVITPIRVRIQLPAEGVNGIRVHASLNTKEALLNLQDFLGVAAQPNGCPHSDSVNINRT